MPEEADMTYFGSGAAFTVSGDPDQLNKMAAYIKVLEMAGSGHQQEMLDAESITGTALVIALLIGYFVGFAIGAALVGLIWWLT
jgi:hypothetical protein